jgi:hypothetical protein
MRSEIRLVDRLLYEFLSRKACDIDFAKAFNWMQAWIDREARDPDTIDANEAAGYVRAAWDELLAAYRA